MRRRYKTITKSKRRGTRELFDRPYFCSHSTIPIPKVCRPSTPHLVLRTAPIPPESITNAVRTLFRSISTSVVARFFHPAMHVHYVRDVWWWGFWVWVWVGFGFGFGFSVFSFFWLVVGWCIALELLGLGLGFGLGFRFSVFSIFWLALCLAMDF